MSAIAVDSLRLFPPLNVPDSLSAYFINPSFLSAQLTTCVNIATLLNIWIQNVHTKTYQLQGLHNQIKVYNPYLPDYTIKQI